MKLNVLRLSYLLVYREEFVIIFMTYFSYPRQKYFKSGFFSLIIILIFWRVFRTNTAVEDKTNEENKTTEAEGK